MTSRRLLISALLVGATVAAGPDDATVNVGGEVVMDVMDATPPNSGTPMTATVNTTSLQDTSKKSLDNDEEELRRQQREACRLNPTWWEPLSDQKNDQLVVNFETCSATTGSHGWNKQTEVVEPQGNYNVDQQGEAAADDYAAYWAQWWHDKEKDTEMRQCLIKKRILFSELCTITPRNLEGTRTTHPTSLFTHEREGAYNGFWIKLSFRLLSHPHLFVQNPVDRLLIQQAIWSRSKMP